MKTNILLIIIILFEANVFSNKIQTFNKVEKKTNYNLILETSASISDTSSEYSNKTNAELKVLLKNAINNEDYETADKIKTILDARPKQQQGTAANTNSVESKSISHIKKGELFICGTFSISTSSKNKESEHNTIRSKDGIYSKFNFVLIPQVGIMLSNKFAVGLGIGFNYSKTTTYNDIGFAGIFFDNIEKESIFSFLPFTRYYIQAGKNAYFFGEFEMGIGVGSYKYKKLNSTGNGIEDGDPTKKIQFSTGLNIGFNYFLNKKWAIEAKWGALSFSSSSYKTEGVVNSNPYYDINKYKDFNFGFDFSSISFGLRVFI